MKKLANLKNELPKKSKLNALQVRNLKGGMDKRKARIGAIKLDPKEKKLGD